MCIHMCMRVRAVCVVFRVSCMCLAQSFYIITLFLSFFFFFFLFFSSVHTLFKETCKGKFRDLPNLHSCWTTTSKSLYTAMPCHARHNQDDDDDDHLFLIETWSCLTDYLVWRIRAMRHTARWNDLFGIKWKQIRTHNRWIEQTVTWRKEIICVIDPRMIDTTTQTNAATPDQARYLYLSR